MQKLKKALAVISAATMIFGCSATAITASADISTCHTAAALVAIIEWTNILEENGIPFTEICTTDSLKGIERTEVLLEQMAEKGLTMEYMYEHYKDKEKMWDMIEKLGFSSDKEINTFLANYMIGGKMGIESNEMWTMPGCGPRADKNCEQLYAEGFTWDDEEGWQFDIEAYYAKEREAKMGNVDDSADVLVEETKVVGDINGDGAFGVADVVTLQKALSTNSVTHDMDINGDGKVNVFDLVAAKRMLADVIGGEVKSL